MAAIITANNIRCQTEALIFMIDATLATVESLELKKKPPRWEVLRQRGIAQAGVRWIPEDWPTEKLPHRVAEFRENARQKGIF